MCCLVVNMGFYEIICEFDLFLSMHRCISLRNLSSQTRGT